MNSSGIKRGLAGSAVAALAVTGLPFLASSASAASGDEIQFVAAGPTRDSVAANAVGGYVVLKTKGITSGETADLEVIGTDLTSSANNANQSVEINYGGIVFVADGASNPFGGADGFDEIYVPVKVDTASTGATANYAIYLDDDVTAGVQSTEPRAQVQQATAGAPATITVDPVTQTAPAGVQSGNYTGTVKDAAGRTTQILATGENISIVTDADTQVQVTTTPPSAEGAAGADGTVTAAEVAQRGAFTFKARSAVTTLHTIGIDGPGAADATAQLDVVAAASGISQGEVDVVTDADTREGFDASNTSAVTVRPDQANVKLDINSPSNAGKTVSVTATGTGVTFGGAASKTYTVTLDAQGKGSITVAVDPASIQSGDSFTVSGSGINIVATYAAPAVTDAGISADAATYLSSFGGTVNPTITVADQYGNPITGVYVTVDRVGGANGADAESERKPVDANGQVTFALTDTSTGTPKATDNLVVRVYPGAFGTQLEDEVVAQIVYSQDGTGADFTVTADGALPAGSAYDPNAVFARPLTDTTANTAVETVDLNITGGTAGAPVTVTVDNGALLLKGTETRLSQASASDSSTIGGDAFKIIGTQSGLVNVTVVSGGRTKTFQVSVRSYAQDNLADPGSARNVAVSGPESGEAGEVVAFTATITDAFGNPVQGVPAANLQTVVSGGGQVIGNSGLTNSAGEITFQVQIADSADGDVSLRVTGSGLQFGAAADRLSAASTTNDGTGLGASEATAVATLTAVNIEELEQAVEDAQAKVDLAQDNLDSARGDLQVAKAEKQVAQKGVKQAKKALKKAKKQHKGVPAAKRELRNAKGDLKVAKAQVKAEQGKVNRAKDRLAKAQAELEAAEQALEDAQND